MQLGSVPDDPAERSTRHSRALYAFSLTAILALCAMAAGLILNMRENAWSQAARSSDSLLRSIERTLDRDIELYDLSLQAVVEGLQNPDLEGASPEVRQLSLFDRAATARGFGTIFVLDQQGQAYIDSRSAIPRSLNAFNRDYFQAHRTGNDIGLFIGKPITSLVSGKVAIPLSRRVAYADGSFAGVVVGTIEVDYFAEIFQRLNIEPGSAIDLFHANGTLLIRNPAGSLTPGQDMAGEPNIRRYMEGGAGRQIARSAMDGVERLYTYTTVGRWPLRVNVALSVQTIEAAWWPKGVAVALLVLAMSGGIGFLTLWLQRELHRRVQAEKAALSANAQLRHIATTDGLTGLPNRRRFDEALADAHRNASTRAFALLLFDADQFKRYNDIYGHLAGDQVLKDFARILQQQVQTDGGLANRIGGEEFAVILTQADEESAVAYAERIREAVAALRIPHAGQEQGVVTTSVGVMHSDRHPNAPIDHCFAAADAALYAAKRKGRNQVENSAPDFQISKTKSQTSQSDDLFRSHRRFLTAYQKS